jgi:hypothetical protein
MVYADGSVHTIDFEIDEQTWWALGNRQDDGKQLDLD